MVGAILINAGNANCATRTGDAVALSTSKAAAKLLRLPVNQVLPPSVATRWIETLLSFPNAGEALAMLARRTGDAARDVAVATFEPVRSRLKPDTLLPILEGEDGRDERSLGRIFGEPLPSGLVLKEQRTIG